MLVKLISDDVAAELTDSILISVDAEDQNDISAGVIWMAEGNVISDEGPLSVPNALVLARTLANEQGKETVHITLQPYTFEWLSDWGKLD